MLILVAAYNLFAYAALKMLYGSSFFLAKKEPVVRQCMLVV